MSNKLSEKILEQIKEDIKNGDLTALEELITTLTSLKSCQKTFKNYLSEEEDE